MIDIAARQRRFLRLLWREGRLSRWELHERTGVNATAVGADIAGLLEMKIVRECERTAERPGRPRMPLEIDDVQRQVVGLAIRPGRVEVGKLNLRGHVIDKFITQTSLNAESSVAISQALLQSAMNDQVLAIGVSATGFVDAATRSILFSAILGGRGAASLAPLYALAGDRPLVLENDMHALAARWLLTHQTDSEEDTLLVQIEDAQLGAALLIGGRPNRGCAIGANELGHTRFFVDTDLCYCGHKGCLERICSTAYLHHHDASNTANSPSAPHRAPAGSTLVDRASRFDGTDRAMDSVLDYLSMGIANAVNLIRPNRLVLVSELTRYPAFNDALMRLIRGRLLTALLQQVHVDLWDQPTAHVAETAGWLALAGLYREGWNRAAD